MLLRQIKLQNIRSYAEQTISFPQGATLLCGDIGSGKSTILQAIEFALFGASRTELPAEALLRKGTTQGSVELQLLLNGQEVVIQRNLKKEKDTIKQTAGSIILNNTKKDLTPVEMKAEILSLMGYPEEYVTKTNNYIYRYTVYTPQEEMKLILQEPAEIRLDTLRKIFNIDKYKQIRENLQIYMRSLRMNIAVRKTKTEHLEEQKQYLQLLRQEEEKAQKSLTEIIPKLEVMRKALMDGMTVLTKQEEEQRAFVELQQRQRMLLAILAEKNQRIMELQQQEEQSLLKLSENKIPEGSSKTEVMAKIQVLESQRNQFIQKQSQLQEKMKLIQQEMGMMQQQIRQLETQVSGLEEKEKLLFLLTEEGKEKAELVEKKVQVEELFLKMQELITKNETLLQQSRDIYTNIGSLSVCPTCVQEVKEEHKHTIQNQEEHKIKQAENLLFELNKNKSLILQQKEEVLRKLELLQQKEILRSKTATEILQLREKINLLLEIKTKYKIREEGYTSVSVELQQVVVSSPLDGIEKEITYWRSMIELFTKQEHWQQQISTIRIQIQQNIQQTGGVQTQLAVVQGSLLTKHDLSESITLQQKSLLSKREEEKLIAVQEAQWNAKREVLLKSIDESKKKVKELEQEKNFLAQEQQLHHWLEEYFTPLTVTIEKQVMVQIHHLFNELFKEWFTILIDNEGISARIDDAFSPVIEQNGYEILFMNLSGGEKTSASLAYRLALNRVINDVIHDIKTKDLLILDEPTDGFSSEQLDKVREVLDRLNLQQTIIVSHEFKIESFVTNVIRVEKEGQMSRVL